MTIFLASTMRGQLLCMMQLTYLPAKHGIEM